MVFTADAGPTEGKATHEVVAGHRGLLIATATGWLCPYCGYAMDWAFSFMCDRPAQPEAPDRDKLRELIAYYTVLQAKDFRSAAFMVSGLEDLRERWPSTTPARHQQQSGCKHVAFELAQRLVDTLPVGNAGLFNPWKESLADDEPINTPQAKLERLAAHLDCQPRSFSAARHLAIRAARALALLSPVSDCYSRAIPRIPALSKRLTSRRLPFSEPSATIVWKALYQVGIADVTLLWNAVQLHPFNVGDHLTNRTPENTS